MINHLYAQGYFGKPPEGFVLVPIEPTERMIMAAIPNAGEWIGHPEASEQSKTRWLNSHRAPICDKYKAMIKAAQEGGKDANNN